LASSEGDCTVSVKDSGLGIPAAEQKEIFRKFVRGETARSQNIPGTGIGLSMALMIVEAHGGRIEVESEPGKGSTFRVVLPAAE
jgi:signal transduction histidine kinase